MVRLSLALRRDLFRELTSLNSLHRPTAFSWYGVVAGAQSFSRPCLSWPHWVSRILLPISPLPSPKPPHFTAAAGIYAYEDIHTELPLALGLYKDKVFASLTSYLALVLATNIANLGMSAAASVTSDVYVSKLTSFCLLSQSSFWPGWCGTMKSFADTPPAPTYTGKLHGQSCSQRQYVSSPLRRNLYSTLRAPSTFSLPDTSFQRWLCVRETARILLSFCADSCF